MPTQTLGAIALLGLGAACLAGCAAHHDANQTQTADQAQVRLTDSSGGFSYVPPPGWQIRNYPGIKYKISSAPPMAVFTPTIVVRYDVVPVDLDRYVRGCTAGIMKHLTDPDKSYTTYHVVSQGAFVTAAGLHGVRLLSDATLFGKSVRQIFYTFPGPSNRKYIATTSWLQADGNKYAAASDEAMKTFTLK